MATRRSLLRLFAAALAGPGLALAQAGRRYSVVVLYPGDSEEDEPATRPFFEEMRRRGWVEGTNIVYERLHGRGLRDYLEGLAELAAGRAPDLIYATTSTLALAVLKASDSIPVVFATASDPVALGLAKSFERPGRNATGTYQIPGDLVATRFSLLREVFPGARRVGILLDRRSGEFQRLKELHEQAARRAGFAVALAEFSNYEVVPKRLAEFRRDGISAALVTPSFTLVARRREVSDAALRNGIALVAHRVEWAEAGALLSYGADSAEAHRRSAAIADRVLKGARPADVPVEQSRNIELVVSQRSAKALGVTFPKALLARAKLVIE